MKHHALINVILLLRPHQWIKNLFVFLPLFFDGKLLVEGGKYFASSTLAFMAFCFANSAVYCFNDIRDREYDRIHREKSKRPVASGALSIRNAYTVMAFCLIATFAMVTFMRNGWTAAIVGAYLIVNFLYCISLKQVAIVDVLIIASGYVLRVLTGGTVTGIGLSHWIVLMTFLLSLFLAFAKRRDDIMLYKDTGIKARRCIAEYNVTFIDQSLSVLVSITMVCYIMYTVSEEVTARFRSPLLYLTSIFVLSGLLRYLLLATRYKSGSPTRILIGDRFIQICVLLWSITYFYLIYCR